MNVSNRQTAEELNQKLVRQYVEIAQLSGALAHEVKNPLSTIRLNMELLGEDFAEAKTPKERRALKKIEVMQRECQRLQNLLVAFLNFAKIRRLRLEPTDLNLVIARTLDFYAPRAAEANVEIIRYLDPELPSVMLDEETFRAALLNLIINAEQAMPDGGQLCVRTFSRGAGAALQLIDTGRGFDEKTGAQIFDAFFSTKAGGSGLGLPTTAKIIEAHDGRISVQSEVGLGTQFTIELPIPPRITAEGAEP
jgi:signal transduction histidine kinase